MRATLTNPASKLLPQSKAVGSLRRSQAHFSVLPLASVSQPVFSVCPCKRQPGATAYQLYDRGHASQPLFEPQFARLSNGVNVPISQACESKTSSHL